MFGRNGVGGAVVETGPAAVTFPVIKNRFGVKFNGIIGTVFFTNAAAGSHLGGHPFLPHESAGDFTGGNRQEPI